jgi:hypothetical protein
MKIYLLMNFIRGRYPVRNFSKNKLASTIGICVFFLVTGCKKNYVPPEADHSIYTSSCSVTNIAWFPDNESVLLESHCGSNQYIINTVTGQQRTWNVGSLIPQNPFSTPEIPGRIFLFSKGQGIFFNLYTLNLADLVTALIKDSINANPFLGDFYVSGKQLAIGNATETQLISLETGSSQKINIGNVQGWSPDNNRLLFYDPYTQVNSATVYDLLCNCSQTMPLNGEGRSIWRPQGIIGYHYRGTFAFSDTLVIQNMQTGAVINNFTRIIKGPWIVRGTDLMYIFNETPGFATDLMGELISYNPFTGETRPIIKATTSLNDGVSTMAVSPDKTKLAYIERGLYLKVVRL